MVNPLSRNVWANLGRVQKAATALTRRRVEIRGVRSSQATILETAITLVV